MKPFVLSLLTVAFLFGTGFSAQAGGMCPENMNFGQMKAMHPELSTGELQEKYKECHGTMGAENSAKFSKDCEDHM